jgi:tetratricopeptide (TPR) repeat protein
MKLSKSLVSLFLLLVLTLSGCAKQNCLECAMAPEELKAKDAVFKDLNKKTLELYQQGKIKDALVFANQSLDYSKKTFGSESPKTATALNNLGELYRIQGKLSDAEQCYKKSLAIREKVLGKNNVQVALSQNNLASVYFAEKRFDKAEALYKDSVEVLNATLGKDDLNTEIMKRNLAEVYKVEKKFLEAETIYKEIITGRDSKKDKKDDVSYAKALNDLAAIYYLQGKYQECLPLFTKTLSILETKIGVNSPDLIVVLDNIAQAYKKTGDNAKALTYTERAKGLRNKKPA